MDESTLVALCLRHLGQCMVRAARDRRLDAACDAVRSVPMNILNRVMLFLSLHLNAPDVATVICMSRIWNSVPFDDAPVGLPPSTVLSLIDACIQLDVDTVTKSTTVEEQILIPVKTEGEQRDLRFSFPFPSTSWFARDCGRLCYPRGAPPPLTRTSTHTFQERWIALLANIGFTSFNELHSLGFVAVGSCIVMCLSRQWTEDGDPLCDIHVIPTRVSSFPSLLKLLMLERTANRNMSLSIVQSRQEVVVSNVFAPRVRVVIQCAVSSVAHCLAREPVDCRCVAFDGRTIWMSARGMWSWVTRCNFPKQATFSLSSSPQFEAALLDAHQRFHFTVVSLDLHPDDTVLDSIRCPVKSPLAQLWGLRWLIAAASTNAMIEVSPLLGETTACLDGDEVVEYLETLDPQPTRHHRSCTLPWFEVEEGACVVASFRCM